MVDALAEAGFYYRPNEFSTPLADALTSGDYVRLSELRKSTPGFDYELERQQALRARVDGCYRRVQLAEQAQASNAATESPGRADASVPEAAPTGAAVPTNPVAARALANRRQEADALTVRELAKARRELEDEALEASRRAASVAAQGDREALEAAQVKYCARVLRDKTASPESLRPVYGAQIVARAVAAVKELASAPEQTQSSPPSAPTEAVKTVQADTNVQELDRLLSQ
jgi:hypothetical protein